jgi:CarboxypepD_reg-like domain/TonB dependent receptor/TonB-dependent Receptor Plug Domain
MNRLIVVCVLLCLTLSLMSQRVTVSGFVTDSLSGETVIAASVHEKTSNVGTFTNDYGFFSLEIPKGKSTLAISYVGYKTIVMELDIEKDSVLNVKMASKSLKEVVVEGRLDQTGVHGVHMSAVTINMDQVQSLPVIMGEADLVKTLQLLPGVKGGTDGSSGMYVRGGGPDQNLFLLDGTPLYNVNHAFGFFSAFDANAIKNVTLYKGDFPARFGGRLSSVVDVRFKDGNNSKIHGNISVGLISSKLFLEGPLFSKNTTFAISGRRTYFDLLLQPIIRSVSSYSSGNALTAGYFFYDLSAKVTHRFSEKDNLVFSGYMGDDVVYANTVVSLGANNLNWYWGNLIGSMKWNHVINNKLFANTSFAFTRYRFDLTIENTTNRGLPEEESFKMLFNSGIYDWSGKVDFDYSPNHNHSFKFGSNVLYHQFIPSVSSFHSQYEGVRRDSTSGGGQVNATEMLTYCEDNFTVNDNLSLNLGLHHSLFNVQSQFYNSLQPRTSVRYLLTDNLSIKGAYSFMTQYIHLLANSNISFPTDLWVPTTRRIAPMYAHQVAAGVFYNLLNTFDVSVEGYYKSMDNLLEYKDGAGFANIVGQSSNWEDKVVTGRGWSYGAELLVKKDIGTTTGWVSYTWAKAERLFNKPGQELNFGNVFPDRFDIRHSISLVLTHKFSENFDIGAVWVYSSGKAGTLAMQDYALDKIENTQNSNYGYYGSFTSTGGYISSRNNYRYPDYHHLDLSFNWHKQKKWGVRTWSIQLFNVYNQMNADYLFDDRNNPKGPSLKKLTIFPFTPSFSYSFKF